MPSLFPSFALFENVEQAKSILKKLGVDPADEGYQSIRNILEKKPGWVGLFTRFHYAEKVPVMELANLYDSLLEMQDFLGRLPKTVIAYENYEELVDALNRLELVRSSSKLYQELTGDHKRFIKAMVAAERSKFDKLSYEFYKLSEDNQQKLLRKLKSFHPDQFLAGLDKYVESLNTDFHYEAVSEHVAQLPNDAQVVYDNEATNVLVVRIKTFNASVELSSNTLWCIRNNELNWNDYVGGESVYTAQYTVYDFNRKSSDPMSMVGVTVNSTGRYRTSHARFDEYLKPSVVEAHLRALGVDVDVLAPLPTAEVKVKKAAVARQKKITSLLYSRSSRDGNLGYAQLDKLITDEDMLTQGRYYAKVAVEQDDEKFLSLIIHKGKSWLNDLLSGSDNQTSAFSHACVVKNDKLVQFMLDRGFDPMYRVSQYTKYIGMYLAKGNLVFAKGFIEKGLQRYAQESLAPFCYGVLSDILKMTDGAAPMLDWALSLPGMDKQQLEDVSHHALYNMTTFKSGSVVEVLRVLTKHGVRMSERIVDVLTTYYLKLPDNSPELEPLLALLLGNRTLYSKQTNPVTFAAKGGHKENARIGDFIAAGYPNQEELASYCTRDALTLAGRLIWRKLYDAADLLLQRLESADVFNEIKTAVETVFYELVPGGLPAFKYLHNRGLRINDQLVKNFAAYDLFTLTANALSEGDDGYGIVKYLFKQGCVIDDNPEAVDVNGRKKDNKQVYNMLKRIAVDNLDLPMFFQLSPELPEAGWQASIFNQAKEKKRSDLAVKFMAFYTKNFTVAATPDLLENLIGFGDLMLVNAVLDAGLKFEPLSAEKFAQVCTNIEPEDQPDILAKYFRFKIPVLQVYAVLCDRDLPATARAYLLTEDPTLRAELVAQKDRIRKLVTVKKPNSAQKVILMCLDAKYDGKYDNTPIVENFITFRKRFR